MYIEVKRWDTFKTSKYVNTVVENAEFDIKNKFELIELVAQLTLIFINKKYRFRYKYIRGVPPRYIDMIIEKTGKKLKISVKGSQSIWKVIVEKQGKCASIDIIGNLDFFLDYTTFVPLSLYVYGVNEYSFKKINKELVVPYNRIFLKPTIYNNRIEPSISITVSTRNKNTNDKIHNIVNKYNRQIIDTILEEQILFLPSWFKKILITRDAKYYDINMYNIIIDRNIKEILQEILSITILPIVDKGEDSFTIEEFKRFILEKLVLY